MPEKLAWLVLGHGPEQMGAGDATTLLSAASGLLGNDSGNVIQQVKKTFGFDELGVRQGRLGDSGGRQQVSRVAGGSVDTTGSTGQQIFTVGKAPVVERPALLRANAGPGGRHRQADGEPDPADRRDQPGRQRQCAGYLLHADFRPPGNARRAQPANSPRRRRPASVGAPPTVVRGRSALARKSSIPASPHRACSVA